MSKHPRAAVIGTPIAHSLSPKLHGYWLKRYGLPGSYTAIDVPEQALEKKLKQMAKDGFIGANVTLPHKVSMLQIADQFTDRATLIGAANTLVFKEDGRIFADNTDAYGFLASMRQGAPNWAPESGPALVLGAGGAARAVIVALAEAGVPEIIVANRTRAKAEALCADFGARLRALDWVQAGMALQEARTLVNTTSLGMAGGQDLKLSLENLSPDCVVSDIVYRPLRTPLLDGAAAKGCTTVDGLGMLLHQGVPGFERWFGIRPEVDAATRTAVLA